MSRYRWATFPLLSAMFLAVPAWAESPLADMRALNVHRLLTTNLCPNCDLVNVNLRGAHLIGADLRKADLTGADLAWVNLEGADLTGANLTGADLTGAFLTNASLVGTDLDNANLSEAQLYFADVTDASMENVNLTAAIIVGTPISVGSGTEPYGDEGKPPIISPEEIWQLTPPVKPESWPDNLIDVPEVLLPIL